MKDYLNYTKMNLYIQLGPRYMARYSGPRDELTCLCHVLRSDNQVLSSECSGPVQKPPGLEVSLLQQRDYLHALGGLRVFLIVAGEARYTNSLLDEISPYSIASVHVAFHQRF